MVDFAKDLMNLLLALFVLRQLQEYLERRNSAFAPAFAYLLH